MKKEELYSGQCIHCGQTFSACVQFGCTNFPSSDPEPDWDEMKKEFDLRLESRYFYCIELKDSAGLYLHKNGRLGRSVIGAVRFFGNDGERMAKVYLAINHSLGYLKNFIVTEHEFC